MLCHAVFHKLYPRTLHKVAGQNLFTLKFSKYGGTMWIENITRGEWVEGVNALHPRSEGYPFQTQRVLDQVQGPFPASRFLVINESKNIMKYVTLCHPGNPPILIWGGDEVSKNYPKEEGVRFSIKMRGWYSGGIQWKIPLIFEYKVHLALL